MMMVEQAWLDEGDVILPKEAHDNFLRLIEFEKDIKKDLKKGLDEMDEHIERMSECVAYLKDKYGLFDIA